MKSALLVVVGLVALGCSAAPQDHSRGESTVLPGPVHLPPIIYDWSSGWDRFLPGTAQLPAIASDGTTWDMVYTNTNGHVFDRTSSDGVHFDAEIDLGGGTFVGTAAAVYATDGL